MSIFFIRHAQSMANAAALAGEPHLMLEDVPLSELGKSQAIDARKNVANLNIESVIVSPLTRTLETAEILFQRAHPIIIDANVREQTLHSGDVGSHPELLAEKWAHLNFSHLNAHWWHDGEEDQNGIPVEPLASLEKRAEAFVALAKHTRMHATAIVSHGNFIRAVTGVQPDNCQVIKLEI